MTYDMIWHYGMCMGLGLWKKEVLAVYLHICVLIRLRRAQLRIDVYVLIWYGRIEFLYDTLYVLVACPQPGAIGGYDTIVLSFSAIRYLIQWLVHNSVRLEGMIRSYWVSLRFVIWFSGCPHTGAIGWAISGEIRGALVDGMGRTCIASLHLHHASRIIA